MYKTIVSDLDGTLFNSQHHISSHTHHVLHKLVNRGIRLVIATGRHPVDVRSIRSSLGLDIEIITANGAVVHDQHGENLFTQFIDPEVVKILAHLPIDQRLLRQSYSNDAWFIERHDQQLLEAHAVSGFYYKVAKLAELANNTPICKVFFSGPNHLLVRLEKQLQALLGDKISMAFSATTYLDIMPPGVNKGQAAERLLQQHGSSLKEAIVFGDSMNDREMLEQAGHGVLMGNAQDRLRESLPKLPSTTSCDEDGVADYLTRIFG